MRAFPTFTSCVLLVTASLSWSREAAAKVWYVGGAGADFDEIQPAIDAAADGDVILVRDGYAYRPFVLEKGLTLRASDAPFFIAPAYADPPITVRNISAGLTARVGGFYTDSYWTYPGTMEIEQCGGHVVVENVNVGGSTVLRPIVTVTSCASVSLTQLNVGADYGADQTIGLAILDSVVQIEASNLRANGAGMQDEDGNGRPGGTGMVLQSSRVVLAHSSVHGGAGGAGLDGYSCASADSGGPGGAGLIAIDSDLLLVGSASDSVVGGYGGAGPCLDYYCDCRASGGDGGPGLVGVARVSGVQLKGGWGGEGGGDWYCGCGEPGDKGADYEGSVSFIIPPYPWLELAGGLQPDSSMLATVHGEAKARVLLVLAERRGWMDLTGVAGCPLGALPGGWFLGFPVGTTDSGGRLDVTLQLSGDLEARGFALTAQAALLGWEYPAALTNAVTRIIGE